MNLKRVSKVIFDFLPSRIKEGLKPHLGVPSIELSLLNLKQNGIKVSNFIDIGAYQGGFASLMTKIWPDSKGLMIEGNPAFEGYLKNLNKENANLSYIIALLASSEKENVPFYLSETASSILRNQGGNGQYLSLKTITLDEVCKQEKFSKKVDFLKLDVQGFELEVLKGGSTVLNNSEIVLLEVALLDLYVDSPLVRDVLNFMYEKAFVLYDICSVDIKRPLDNTLWQSDFLFVRENSILRSNKLYH